MNGVKSCFGRNWNRDEMMNDVKSYFGRNWNRDDVMSNVKSYFKTRVLLLMLAACLFGDSVNAFTNYLFKIEQRLLKVATRICAFLANLYVVTTFACSVTTLLLLYVLQLLAGTTTGCGSFLYRIIRTRKRRKIYVGCMKYCFVIMLSTFGFVVLDRSHTIHWVINASSCMHTM
ncbi:hypothetical protein H5410_037900 [Solanum commersonii]|uniref:Uncharacterized protein n=1 Tax=Solanum commersonii TaxID=4109 RepID=A0A9J5YBJ3_SOLCO|nr:hypothetical protein H5410_037892 [Solanum commersonii]KAG5596668.1 hypothetical protein H5410_037900 [Solanum commersonii]